MIIHTSISRKKKQQKFSSVEAKRRHMECSKEWDSLKSRWGCSTKKTKTVVVELPTVAKSAIRETNSRGRSLNSWVTGPVNNSSVKVYTGTNIIGIGTMHKSNAIPIFSNQEAEDIAKMRR